MRKRKSTSHAHGLVNGIGVSRIVASGNLNKNLRIDKGICGQKACHRLIRYYRDETKQIRKPLRTECDRSINH